MKRTVLTTTLVACFAMAYSQSYFLQRSSFLLNRDSLSTLPVVETMVDEILRATGVNEDFVVKAAEVRNMQATVSGKRKLILYNPEFVSWLYLATRDRWATVTLLAHEIGHHYRGHTGSGRGSRPSVELEADEFAGFALHRMGASLDQAKEVMKYVARNEGSSTHPARHDRMNAIETGWKRAAARP